MIKEVSDNNGLLKAVKTLFIDDLCVDKEARGQKIGERSFINLPWTMLRS